MEAADRLRRIDKVFSKGRYADSWQEAHFVPSKGFFEEEEEEVRRRSVDAWESMDKKTRWEAQYHQHKISWAILIWVDGMIINGKLIQKSWLQVDSGIHQ